MRVIRLSLNVNDETAAALSELAEKRSTTITEVLRRAVSVLKFIEDRVGDDVEVRQVLQCPSPATTLGPS